MTKKDSVKKKVLKELEGSKKMEELYGLWVNPFAVCGEPQFSKDFNKIIIKNDLEMGMYKFSVREPEHSTFKIDLRQITPKENNEIKQVRISFGKRDFIQAIAGLIRKVREEAIDLTEKLKDEVCEKEKEDGIFKRFKIADFEEVAKEHGYVKLTRIEKAVEGLKVFEVDGTEHGYVGMLEFVLKSKVLKAIRKKKVM